MSGRPIRVTRRQALKWAAGAAAGLALGAARGRAQTAGRREFDVRDFGARGDGATLDTAAIQRAIEAAAAAGGRVLLPGGRRFLCGTLALRSGIDFHLADDAVLLASLRPGDYAGGLAVSRAVAAEQARVAGVQPTVAERGASLLTAPRAVGLSLSGTGRIDGRSPEFMARYDAAGEWWRPGPFRPNLAVLVGCRDLSVTGLTFAQAPIRTLHLAGCERVLVDGVIVRNQLDVPNCDGIDPDRCRDVEIRNCDIVCGDDAICVKASRPFAAYGETARIRVRDCRIETQDAGVKIGTETTGDIRDVVFERCRILGSSRGVAIQLRDEGSVSGVTFADITFLSRCFSDPWWGRGEALSLTAIPRAPGGKIGEIRGVTLRNVRGRAENSARICGSPGSRIRDVTLESVAVELDRWTRYPGGLWDNRPTSAEDGIEPRRSVPAFGLRDADNVVLHGCRASWGARRPDYFTHALEAERVGGLRLDDFQGEGARPGVEAIAQRA